MISVMEDLTAGAVYVRIMEGTSVRQQSHAGDAIIVDLDEVGNVLGVEIIGAPDHMELQKVVALHGITGFAKEILGASVPTPTLSVGSATRPLASV